MWKKIKHAYHEFVDEKPGKRFIEAHQRWKSGSPAVTILVVVVGALLVVVGFLLGLIPGVPGIVLGVLGIALIATRFRRMAVWMDWMEVKCRKLKQRWSRRIAAYQRD